MTSIPFFILWYITITLLGWLAFPIAYRLLPALPDRGYTIARALGLLVWGFAFWLLASLGVLQNSTSGVVMALLILGAITIWVSWRNKFHEVWEWIKEHKKLVLASEALFLVAFVIWAFVRSANPNITDTEKPMELAFINSILRSPAFPPNDPWLSGYAISYYYFGYVIVTMLIRITGVGSGYGFNLAAALWFALTALGAYGVVFNLFQLWHKRATGGQRKGLYSLPLFGPLLVLVVSNLEGILDVLHSMGAFWQQTAGGTWQSSFWQWLNIAELTSPPPLPLSLMPTRPGGVLWWRASRVVQDFTLNGAPKEIIDEFPFFSYLLSDLHPHVLAMPFVLLAILLALNVFLGGGGGYFSIFGFRIPLSKSSFIFSAVALGGLAFLNTWDFPIYMVLFCGAFALSQYFRYGWSGRRVGEFLTLAVSLGITSIVIYLPFYVGFQSQAGGLLPSLIYFTQGKYFWVMFAPLLIPIFIFIFYVWKHIANKAIIWRSVGLVAALIFGLWALSFIFGFAISLLPNLGELFLNAQGVNIQTQGIGSLLSAAFVNRILAPGTWITLAILLAFVLALLYRKPAADRSDEIQNEELPDLQSIFVDHHAFPFLLILVGGLLALFPEFFYLQDQFGYRINTIFKFYFETWIIWGVAAAYCVAVLLSVAQKVWGTVLRFGLVVLLAISFAYPIFGLWNKTNGFDPSTGLTLDGNAYLGQFNPDELAAMEWLQAASPGVIAEAIGGQYTNFARMATHTGLPTVLGWPGHESQWRGGSDEMGSRQTDIQTLYETSTWQTALSIIQEYNIKYIVVGSMELSTYHVNATKFNTFLNVGFKQGSVTIYNVPAQFETASTRLLSGATVP